MMILLPFFFIPGGQNRRVVPPDAILLYGNKSMQSAFSYQRAIDTLEVDMASRNSRGDEPAR